MPYFIDRHERCDTITPELAAQQNFEDIKLQHKFNCRKIAYWLDDKSKTAFCLFEAPNKECLEAMHNEVHANVPNLITELDKSVIDTFLKQLKRLPNTERLERLGPPTFLACDLGFCLLDDTPLQLKLLHKDYNTSVNEAIKHFGGNVISQIGTFTLLAFHSETSAINCALKIHRIFFKEGNQSKQKYQLKIGISGSFTLNGQDNNVKASAKLAQRLCYLAKNQILVTHEVKNHFISSNTKVVLKGNRVKSLSPEDVHFINQLLNYIERNWKNPNLNANIFNELLGYSKSQLYRKMIRLTGESPNTFIKAYRLFRAAELLRQKKGNISEIAFGTGFNSASYFTKCFQKEYGLKPSQYISELT